MNLEGDVKVFDIDGGVASLRAFFVNLFSESLHKDLMGEVYLKVNKRR